MAAPTVARTASPTATVVADANISKIDKGNDRFKGFLAGTASGVTKCLVGHPFDTIKIRLQVSHGRFTGPWDCLKTTISKEGIRALYKGVTPPLVGWTIMDSIMLGSLTYYRHSIATYIKNPRRPTSGKSTSPLLTIPEHSLAGAMAGLTVAFVATPVEHIKARLQLQYDGEKKFKGPIGCAKQVIAIRGISGLWTGLSATMIHRAWFAAWWGSYEYISRVIKKRYNHWSEGTINFLAGGLSANFYWCCCFPFDVIKNRIMTEDITRPKTSWPNTARHIYAQGGLTGFYRGFLPCFLRSFPTNACALLAFETTLRALKK